MGDARHEVTQPVQRWSRGAEGALDHLIEIAYDDMRRLFPVGEARSAARLQEPRVELYGPDGLHPSLLGTYTADVVTYAQLSGRSPIGLPRIFAVPGGGVVMISADDAATIQAVAAFDR